MAAYAAHTINYNTHLLTTKKTKNKQTRATQKSLPFGKRKFREKRGQENGPKAEKDTIQRATGLGRRSKRGDIAKWDQTESHEIPDRGKKSEISRPPFGCPLLVVSSVICLLT